MPFTPSHVAAVLPFVRTPLIPAALVIGSMGPDLFFCVPLPIPRDFTHSWLGAVTVDLAFGVALYLLWRFVLRRPFVDFTPRAIRARVATVPSRPIRPTVRFAIPLVASVLVGTATHIVWDSFTHDDWVVWQLPALATQTAGKPIYSWLQYASSLVGFLILVAWAIAWVRRTVPFDPAKSRASTRLRAVAWATVTCVGLGTSLPIWIAGIAVGISPVGPVLVFETVTRGLGAAGLASLVWAVVWWLLPTWLLSTPNAEPR